MERPKRPGKNAGPNAWERYYAEKAAFDTEQAQQRATNFAGPIVGAAIGIAQALAGPGLAGAAFPGQEVDAAEFGNDWRKTSQQEQRDRQSEDIESGTRDKGNRTGWSGQGR